MGRRGQDKELLPDLITDPNTDVPAGAQPTLLATQGTRSTRRAMHTKFQCQTAQ